MRYVAGLDIGGTKLAVTLAQLGEPAKVLAVPGGKTEAETAQSLALAAQMLACKTSCLRGLNPDSPRALKKVTVTV